MRGTNPVALQDPDDSWDAIRRKRERPEMDEEYWEASGPTSDREVVERARSWMEDLLEAFRERDSGRLLRLMNALPLLIAMLEDLDMNKRGSCGGEAEAE